MKFLSLSALILLINSNVHSVEYNTPFKYYLNNINNVTANQTDIKKSTDESTQFKYYYGYDNSSWSYKNIKTIKSNQISDNILYIDQKLFKDDYNREYYDQVSSQCIKNISSIKQEDSRLFEELNKTFFYCTDFGIYKYKTWYYNPNTKENSVLNSILLPIQDLRPFAILFDSFNTSSNNLEQLNKYIKDINPNSIPLINFYKYIRSQIIKLKAQTFEKLEQNTKYLSNTILNYNKLKEYPLALYINNAKINHLMEHNTNKSNDNQKLIITNAIQVLYDVFNLFTNILSDLLEPANFVNILMNVKTERINLEKMLISLLHECEYCRNKINTFDSLYYYGSKLQTRFDNLHNKIIGAFNKVIRTTTLKVFSDTISFDDIVRYKYKLLLGYTDDEIFDSSSSISRNNDELINLFDLPKKSKVIYENDIPLVPLSEPMKKTVMQLNTVKQIADEKIKKQIDEFNTLPIDDNTIKYYLLIAFNIIVRFDDKHINTLIQCEDFIDLFLRYCGIFKVRNRNIINYNPGQSPEETFFEVLDNPNDSFNI